MKKARVFMHGLEAGILKEIEKGKSYIFKYSESYKNEPVSQTMPIIKKEYKFNSFPSFFDGLLPEGVLLEGLLRRSKIDRNDYFSQLVTVGADLVGAVTVEEI